MKCDWNCEKDKFLRREVICVVKTFESDTHESARPCRTVCYLRYTMVSKIGLWME